MEFQIKINYKNAVAYTEIWKGGTRGGLGSCPQWGPGAAPRWGVRGQSPPEAKRFPLKLLVKLCNILQYCSLWTTSYVITWRAKKNFQTVRGGKRTVSPPPKYATAKMYKISDPLPMRCFKITCYS